MPPLKEILASNAAILKRPFTAVFVGATSGIGLGGVRALVTHSGNSKIYIVGRSRSTFLPTLSALQSLSPTATLIFIEAQVSQLSEVSRVCRIIASHEPYIDILWTSQGGLDMSAHTLTPTEGLFSELAITYYSRVLFMHTLLPQLDASEQPGGARVISVLSAGHEGKINTTDIGIKDPENYTSFWEAQKHIVAMLSLAMTQLANENPKIAFLHTSPGLVATSVHDKWGKTMTGLWAPAGWLLRFVVMPIVHTILATSPEDAGEIGFYQVTSDRYGAENEGRNFFRLSEKAEDIGEPGLVILDQYLKDGTQKKVWSHTLSEFERVLEST